MKLYSAIDMELNSTLAALGGEIMGLIFGGFTS